MLATPTLIARDSMNIINIELLLEPLTYVKKYKSNNTLNLASLPPPVFDRLQYATEDRVTCLISEDVRVDVRGGEIHLYTRGVWRHASPENLDCLRLLLVHSQGIENFLIWKQL